MTQAQDGLTEAQKRWNERVDEALGPNHQVVESLQDYYDITGNTDDELEDLALSIESLSAEVDRAQEAQDKANETAEEYEKTVQMQKKVQLQSIKIFSPQKLNMLVRLIKQPER